MLPFRLREEIQYPEWRVLYDSKMRLSDPQLSKNIINCVKMIRTKYNSKNTRDPLITKMKQFPNEGDWARAKIKELEQVIYDEHKAVPANDLGKWRSIEFELIFNNEDAMKQFVTEARRMGYAKFVTIKHDGSLRIDEDDRSGGLCKEVVITYQSGKEDIVRALCGAIKDKAYVNNTCGTHVHFDMRNIDERTAKKYGRRIARCVPALRTLLPKSRRTSKYCLNPINDFMGTNNDRYSFVNMQAYRKYQTIEIRGHSGTLNANKILNWIAICEKIMDARIRTKTEEISDPNELIKIYKLDGILADYVRERHKKYNALDKSAVPAVMHAPIINLDQVIAG